MATYNGGAFILEQLQSLAAQTLLPGELVLSDDGSTDDTLEIVRAFAKTAPFPVYVINKAQHLGFGDNFLFAVEHCQMELVALCDQDDVWLPEKLEKGVARLLADSSILSMHQLIMTDATLHPIGPWYQGIDRSRTWRPLEINPLSGWGNTMVFRRELAAIAAREERPWDPLYGRLLSHDTWLYILAAAMGDVSHIAEPLILYRQHGANVAGMSDPGIRRRIRAAATAPLSTYRGRRVFYDELATIFDRVAVRKGSSAATAAASRYRARAAYLALRGRLYEEPTVTKRLRAFGTLRLRHDPDMRSLAMRVRSLAKDLALGVTGWGYRA